MMIKFGLLGCGRIAKRHSELLEAAISAEQSSSRYAIPIRGAGDVIASKFGVPADLRDRCLSCS